MYVASMLGAVGGRHVVICHMICAVWFVQSAVVFTAYDVDGTRTLDRVGNLDFRDNADGDRLSCASWHWRCVYTIFDVFLCQDEFQRVCLEVANYDPMFPQNFAIAMQMFDTYAKRCTAACCSCLCVSEPCL
jgi:hypothetical protein